MEEGRRRGQELGRGGEGGDREKTEDGDSWDREKGREGWER